MQQPRYQLVDLLNYYVRALPTNFLCKISHAKQPVKQFIHVVK